MKKTHYVSGEWNVICDVCGGKYKASQVKHRWDGLVVCPDDFEMRHEQDFVQPRNDQITVPFSRPRPVDIFTDVTYINAYVYSGYINDYNNYVQDDPL